MVERVVLKEFGGLVEIAIAVIERLDLVVVVETAVVAVIEVVVVAVVVVVAAVVVVVVVESGETITDFVS